MLSRVVTAQWLPDCLVEQSKEELEEGGEEKRRRELAAWRVGLDSPHTGKTITQMQLPILLSYIRQLSTHGHTQTHTQQDTLKHTHVHVLVAHVSHVDRPE